MNKIIVGLSAKRPGPEQYSSDGFHLTVEMEKEIVSPEDFHQSVGSLFSEVKAALHAEIAHNGGQDTAQGNNRHDLWTGGGNDRRSHQRADSGHQRSGGNGNITNKQAKYLVELGAKRQMPNQSQLEEWIHSELGIERGLFELTRTEASRCIDALRENGGK